MAQGEEAARALGAALAEEQAAASRALAERVRRDDVRHALFLLVPAVLDALDGTKGGPLDRALERRLYLFAQRLAAKNETTSFFGPLTHAQVDPTREETAFGPETPDGVVRREAFAAFWAVATFAAAIASDRALRPALPVRRIPAAAVDATGAYGPDGLPATLDAEARALFASVDGERTLAQLAQAAGLAEDVAERALRTLERAAFARRDLEPSSLTPHPLQDLLGRLPAHPAAEPWRAALHDVEARLRAFEAAPLERRRGLLVEAEAAFTARTGKPAHRGAGQMYADRTVLFEDCAGDQGPVRIARARRGPWRRRWRRCSSSAPGTGGCGTGRCGRWPRRCWPRSRPIRFLAFAAALDARIAEGALRPLDTGAQAFLADLAQRVRAASDGRVARLPPEALADLCAVDERGPASPART